MQQQNTYCKREDAYACVNTHAGQSPTAALQQQVHPPPIPLPSSRPVAATPISNINTLPQVKCVRHTHMQHAFTVLLVLAAWLPGHRTAAQVTCAAGWTLLPSKSSCVRASTTTGTWSDSVCATEYPGSEMLGDIRQGDTQTFASAVTPLFVGATRVKSIAARWKWGNNAAMTLPWATGHPKHGQFCAALCASGVMGCEVGKVYSSACDSSQIYISRRPQPCTQSFTGWVTAPVPAPTTWTSAYCYTVSDDSPVENTLVVIANQAELDAFAVDMAVLKVDKGVVGAYFDRWEEFTLLDGGAVPPDMWLFGEPDDHECTYIGGPCKSHMCDHTCTNVKEHLCEEAKPTGAGCPVGSLAWGATRCLTYGPSSAFTPAACVAPRVLAQPRTLAELNSMKVAIGMSTTAADSAGPQYWFGITRMNFLRGVNRWTWAQADATYSTAQAKNWGPSDPDYSNSCTVLQNGETGYRARPCNYLRKHICEKNDPACTTAYRTTRGSCLFLSTATAEFNKYDAADCPRTATLATQADYDAAVSLITAASVEAWTGLTRINKNADDGWSVTAGTYDTVALWGPTRRTAPLTRNGDCAAIGNKNDFAQNHDCASVYPHLCRMPIVTDAPPTDAPPTDAPPTDAPPTSAPPTDAPPTNAPPTDAPPTNAPPTDAPPTDAPPTNAPPTDAPPTDAPPTNAPPTDAPPTDAPPTDAPATDAPPTDAPATGAPPTDAPPTQAPETSAPPTETPPDFLQPGATLAPKLTVQRTAEPLALEGAKGIEDASVGIGTGGAVVGIIASPATAVYASQMALVMAMECHPETDWSKLSRIMHPTQITIADSALVGAVLCNLGLIVVFYILHSIVTVVATPCMSSFLAAQGLLRFPSAGLFVFFFLYQGTVFASVRLVFHSDPGRELFALLVGICGWIICITVPIITAICVARITPTGRRWVFCNRATADPRVRYRTDRRTLDRPKLAFLLGPGEWVSRRRETRWDDRFTTVLRPYNEAGAWCGSLFQFSLMMGLGVANSVGTPTLRHCGHVKLACGLLYLTLVTAHLSVRPFCRPRDVILEPAISMTFAIALFCMSGGFYSSRVDGPAFDAAAVFLKIGTGILGLKLLLDLISEAYIFCKVRRDRLQEEEWGDMDSRQKAAEEAADRVEMLWCGDSGADAGRGGLGGASRPSFYNPSLFAVSRSQADTESNHAADVAQTPESPLLLHESGQTRAGAPGTGNSLRTVLPRRQSWHGTATEDESVTREEPATLVCSPLTTGHSAWGGGLPPRRPSAAGSASGGPSSLTHPSLPPAMSSRRPYAASSFNDRAHTDPTRFDFGGVSNLRAPSLPLRPISSFLTMASSQVTLYVEECGDAIEL